MNTLLEVKAWFLVPAHYVPMIAFVIFAWEHWLPNTNRVKSNSTVEMISRLLISMARKFVPGEQEEEKAIEKVAPVVAAAVASVVADAPKVVVAQDAPKPAVQS